MDYYDSAFAKNNITTKQYSLLVNLSRLGEANVVELAEYVNLERSTVTRNLKILISNNWVCDLAKEKSRSHRYIVTKEGEQQIKKSMPIWNKCQSDLEAFLGKENTNALINMLYSIQSLQEEK